MHVEFGRVEHEENGVCLFVWLFCDTTWYTLYGALLARVVLTFAFSMPLCLSTCTLLTVLGEIL